MERKRKWFCLLCAGLLAAASGCSGPGGGSVLTVRVDPARQSRIHGGVFEGWGTSLCWWANRLGGSETLSRQAAEAFCDPVKGLGLNILRYNIGGGDDPAHDHITRTDSMMSGFWKNPAAGPGEGEYRWEYDWSRDARQRNVLQKCLEAGGDGMLVEAFSNSPPYFMTRSGCSSGAVRASENNLKEDAFPAFARYLAEVCAHFASEWGIRFQSISPMNEPGTSYWQALSPKQEGCHFDPGAAQSRMLTALDAELQARGLEEILIAGTDETSIDTQIRSLQQLSPEALDVLSRIDTHTYGGSRRRKLRELALASGKNLWMSEVDGGETLGRNAGEMGAGLWLADRIAEDLNGLTPSAWILWQVIDSHISQEGYLGRKDSGMVNTAGGYWGAAVADHDREVLILTMKYYVLGQFTRYIRPGSRLIEVDGPAVAALSPSGDQLTAVLFNREAASRDAQLDLSAFGNRFPAGCQVRVIRTSGTMAQGEHWAELPDEKTGDGFFRTRLAPHSVTTFLIDTN